MFSNFAVFALVALLSVATAEFGECHFDEKFCSCKMGKENQGVCWDQVQGDPLNCKPRSCKRGWTCACGERTHLCNVGMLSSEHNTGAPVTMTDMQAPKELAQVVRQEKSLVRPCSSQAARAATKTDIQLGSIKFAYSETGALANRCVLRPNFCDIVHNHISQ